MDASISWARTEIGIVRNELIVYSIALRNKDENVSEKVADILIEQVKRLCLCQETLEEYLDSLAK